MKTRIEKVTIKDKLHCINNVYDNCLSNEPHLFNKLRDPKHQKMVNHIIFDVLEITKDTWDVIELAKQKIKSKMHIPEYILFINGLLQTMYVHQDLMDELIWICKLDNQSTIELRNKIRDIRNELVGHPVNSNIVDEEKRIVSTIEWRLDNIYDEDQGLINLEYIYRPEGSLRDAEFRRYDLSYLIRIHEKYVNHVLDMVLKEFKSHLRSHIKNQENILKIYWQKDDLQRYKVAAKIIDDEQVGICQLWNKWTGYYSYNNLEKAIDRYNDAERYKHYIDDYFHKVTETLMNGKDNIYIEYFDRIEEMISGKKTITIYDDVNVTFVLNGNNTVEMTEEEKVRNSIRYYISKLYEQNYYDDIGTMKRILKDHPSMLIELSHMQDNWSLGKAHGKNSEHVDRNNEMEYYVALLYLEKLISKEFDDISV